jgi:hypothetical protein
MLNEMLGPGYRRSFKGSSTLAPFELGFADEILGDFDELMERVPDAKGPSLVLFQFFPYKKIDEVNYSLFLRFVDMCRLEMVLMSPI